MTRTRTIRGLGPGVTHRSAEFPAAPDVAVGVDLLARCATGVVQ